MDLDRSRLALLSDTANGQIAKGLARRLPSRLSRGLEGQEATPPGGFKGEALALCQCRRLLRAGCRSVTAAPD